MQEMAPQAEEPGHPETGRLIPRKKRNAGRSLLSQQPCAVRRLKVDGGRRTEIERSAGFCQKHWQKNTRHVTRGVCR